MEGATGRIREAGYRRYRNVMRAQKKRYMIRRRPVVEEAMKTGGAIG